MAKEKASIAGEGSSGSGEIRRVPRIYGDIEGFRMFASHITTTEVGNLDGEHKQRGRGGQRG